MPPGVSVSTKIMDIDGQPMAVATIVYDNSKEKYPQGIEGGEGDLESMDSHHLPSDGSGVLKSMGSGRVTSNNDLGVSGRVTSNKAVQLEQLKLGKKPESKEEFNMIGELSKKERLERSLAMLRKSGPRSDTTSSATTHDRKISMYEKAIAELEEIAPTINEALVVSAEIKKNQQEISELQEYMKGDEEFFGSSFDADKEELARLEKNEVILKAKLLRLQASGPRTDTLSSAQVHDNKISILNKAIEQNAVLISQQKVTAGAGGGSMNAPIIANKTINNQNSDTIFATSAITVNPESTLRQSARNIQDDAIL